MGQVLHGCATTTHAVRTAIQRSKAPLKELAARYGLNHKTVAKWRKLENVISTSQVAHYENRPPLSAAFAFQEFACATSCVVDRRGSLCVHASNFDCPKKGCHQPAIGGSK